jgi:Trp operon repressor
MNQLSGLEYAKENDLLEENPKEFYKLFKYVARIKNLTGNEKLILSMILSYSYRKMEFKMSNRTLAEEAGMAETTVNRTLNSLKGENKDSVKWITCYKIRNKNNHNIIGRVIVPNKKVLSVEIEKSYNEYEYVEY